MVHQAVPGMRRHTIGSLGAFLGGLLLTSPCAAQIGPVATPPAATTPAADSPTDCQVLVPSSPLEYRQFDKIEITGSAIIAPESRQAQPIDVICRRRIDASGASSLSQLLNQWPGLLYRPDSNTLQSLSGTGPLPAAIHGRPEGTLVLLNGRRLPAFGLQGLSDQRAVVDLDLLPLSAVDHVHVMSNGASARYGADATAGVVNIVTRPVTAGTSLRVQGRSQGGTLANLSWGNGRSQLEGLRLQAHLEAEQQDSLAVSERPAAVAPGRLPLPGDASLQPALRRHLAYLEGQWAFSSDWDAFAQVLYGHTHLRSQSDLLFMPVTPVAHSWVPGPPWVQSGVSPDPSLPQHLQTRAYQQVTGGLRGRWQQWELSGSVSGGQHAVQRQQFLSAPSNAAQGEIDQGVSRLSTLDLLGSRTLGELQGQAIELGLGLNWREEALLYRPRLARLNAFDAQRQLWAVHGELMVPTSATQQLTLALRGDHYSDMGAVHTGKLAWRWQALPNLMWRASGGQGFRAPALGQRSTLQAPGLEVRDPLEGQRVAVLLRGNPALTPERTRDLSMGLRFDLTPRWTLGADLWQVRARETFGLPPAWWVLQNLQARAQALQTDALGQPQLVLTQQSLGRARSAGLDYEVQWRQPTAIGLLRLEFKGTAYLRSQREDRSSGTLVSDLGRRSAASGTVMPRHQLMLGGQLDREGWHGSFRLYYRHGHEEPAAAPDVTSLQVPAHWTLDLVQHWDLSRAWQLSLSVHNVFNRIPWVPQESDGRVAPLHPQDPSLMGRQLRLQAQYRF